MRKTLALLVALSVVVFTTFAFAEFPSIQPGSFTGPSTATVPLWGQPGATKTVYVDNTARSIASLITRAGGSFMGGVGGGLVPIGAFISCATTVTHWAFGGTSPTTAVGHTFPADSSWHLPGPFYVSTGMGIGAGASDNVACQMTLEY